MVVIGQVIFRKLQYGLGLQRRYKRAAQSKQQRPLQVGLSGDGDRSTLLSAFQPQFPLMLPLVQITEVTYKQSAGERLPHSIVRSDLSPVRRLSELRVRTKMRRDLLRLGLIDI